MSYSWGCVQAWAFSLCKANMEAIYNTSWGWSDKDKREELTAPEARFLVAFDKARGPARCPALLRASTQPQETVIPGAPRGLWAGLSIYAC